MMKKVCFFLMICFGLYPAYLLAYSFHEAIDNLGHHPSLQPVKTQVLLFKEQGKAAESWGRPVLKASARNLIGERMSSLQNASSSVMSPATMMRLFEVQISQKFPLTSIYRKKKQAYRYKREAQNHTFEDQKRKLIKGLWVVLITSRRLKEEIQILQENLDWIASNIAISEKLYTSGVISQQALLAMQIRKSELEATLQSKQFELKKQDEQWQYLVDLKGALDPSSIPWNFLEVKAIRQDLKDHQELALKANIQARNFKAKAAKLAKIPDMTFSVSYTRILRSREDFISAGISLPLPFSRKQSALQRAEELQKRKGLEHLEDYRRSKKNQKQQLSHSMQQHLAEIRIIDQGAIPFAKNAKEITSKSYSSGQADYKTLLESEFQLQKLLLKRSWLKAQLATNQISYKYLIGDDLYQLIEN